MALTRKQSLFCWLLFRRGCFKKDQLEMFMYARKRMLKLEMIFFINVEF